MARVVVLTDDLLFGSNVLEALRAGGSEAVLAGDAAAAERELPGGELLIVDLTSGAAARIEAAAALRRPGLAMMAFYAHVESDVRAAAERAGFDLVVPRSRMAREGASLVARLLTRDG
jgi:hypothetical protein